MIFSIFSIFSILLILLNSLHEGSNFTSHLNPTSTKCRSAYRYNDCHGLKYPSHLTLTPRAILLTQQTPSSSLSAWSRLAGKIISGATGTEWPGPIQPCTSRTLDTVIVRAFCTRQRSERRHHLHRPFILGVALEFIQHSSYLAASCHRADGADHVRDTNSLVLQPCLVSCRHPPSAQRPAPARPALTSPVLYCAEISRLFAQDVTCGLRNGIWSAWLHCHLCFGPGNPCV